MPDAEESKNYGLIKSKNGTVQGYASGKWSAIFVQDGKLIWLKGCGMYDEGFYVTKDEMMGTIEFRGSHYLFTSLVEFWFADKINEILVPYGFNSGNKPIGVIQYSKDANYELLGLKNELPEYDKYCAVFETLSDKRLASHLLQGLERLNFYVESSFDLKNLNELILK